MWRSRLRRPGSASPRKATAGTTDPDGLAQIADTLSQDAAAGRLSQVINRWIYTACLVFGLDLADQQRTCFTYAYSVYQVEYSRNLLFACGRQMQDVFDAAVDRTRSRLDVPQVITLFGAKMRPRAARGRPPRLEVVIETPAHDLTKFKVHSGNLEGLYQRRTRPAVRRHRPQHQGPALRPHPGQVRAHHHPAQADGGGVLHGTGLRRCRLHP